MDPQRGSDEEHDRNQATLLLGRVQSGDAIAAEELLPIVYEQLRALAGHCFRAQRPDHTLQPTALVHEAYLKLINSSGSNWQNRAHFCAVASRAMRQILTNHAVAKRTAKRGGEAERIPLEAVTTPSGKNTFDAVALDEALTKLGQADARQARVVELRFFGDLDVPQVAEVLEISPRTVERDWRSARAWLQAELAGDVT